MTTIERTAYPRFKKTLSKRELNTTYTPTPAEIAFAQAHAYGPQSQFNLLVSLKCFQRLGFFPAPADIPSAVIKHIRQTLPEPSALQYSDEVPRTMYRQLQLIRDYLHVTDYADGGEAVVSMATKVRDITVGQFKLGHTYSTTPLLTEKTNKEKGITTLPNLDILPP